MKIAVFYHCLFYLNGEPLEHACKVVYSQMRELQHSGLLDSAAELHVGVNGGPESDDFVKMLLPRKANVMLHGLESRAENLTIVALEKWVRSHPDWAVLYFHSKGATRGSASTYDGYITKWRECLMKHCIHDWRLCVTALKNGFEAAGAHWLTGMGPDRSQNLFAGNFWWAKAAYLMNLPSIFQRDRIQMSGIAALESRHEAEVWIGNGRRLPRVRDMHKTSPSVCGFDPSMFMRKS